MVEWDNGVVSVVEAGWWHPHMEGPEAATRVYGTEGYASLFPTLLRTGVNGSQKETKPRFPARQEHCDQHAYTGQMADFATAIRTGRSPRSDGGVGLAAVAVVEAAYAASRTKQVVEIEKALLRGNRT